MLAKGAESITLLKHAVLALTGYCAGMVVAGAIIAFIAAIGIVPRLAHRTKTTAYIKVYEEAIILGGVFGASAITVDFRLPLGILGVIITGLTYGVFIGCVAVCLAEILNVLPIMGRRIGLQKGINALITSFAAGKIIGALLYFYVPGFIKKMH